MEFNLNVNQKALIESAGDTPVNANIAFIITFIFRWVNKPSTQTIEEDNVIYYWVSHSLLIKEMPILGIKSKKGIAKILDRLVHSDWLIKYPKSQSICMSYYGLGTRFDTFLQKCQALEQSFQGLEQKEEGAWNKRSKPLGTNVPTNINSNKNINTKNIKILLDDFFEKIILNEKLIGKIEAKTSRSADEIKQALAEIWKSSPGALGEEKTAQEWETYAIHWSVKYFANNDGSGSMKKNNSEKHTLYEILQSNIIENTALIEGIQKATKHPPSIIQQVISEKFTKTEEAIMHKTK